MKSSAFIAASAAVILLLGLVHLIYTFRGPELHPRDPDLTARMMAVSPLITREGRALVEVAIDSETQPT
jgi:hypothetical protein